MPGSVALSPAAAILKCVHARTWRSPSPPLPREQGRLPPTENQGRCIVKQSVGHLPAAWGPSQGWGRGRATTAPTWPAPFPRGQHLPGTVMG